MNLPLSRCKPTWTESAEKGSQGVHFACNQLIIDFLLVLQGAEEALRENPGLVFPWKTSNKLSSVPA